MMTEQAFDQKIEELAEHLEKTIEASADKLDKGMTYAWNNSRLFRIITRGTSIIAEIGLLISAKRLAEGGYKHAATWFAVLGAIGLIIDLARLFVFRRRK